MTNVHKPTNNRTETIYAVSRPSLTWHSSHHAVSLFFWLQSDPPCDQQECSSWQWKDGLYAGGYLRHEDAPQAGQENRNKIISTGYHSCQSATVKSSGAVLY